MDGNSSELEEDEEEGGGGGRLRVSQLIPQTPDQEAFLREHFVTLGNLSGSGTAGSLKHNNNSNMQHYTVNTTNKVSAVFTSEESRKRACRRSFTETLSTQTSHRRLSLPVTVLRLNLLKFPCRRGQ